MAFKLRSGNKPAFKNMGSSPAMQKNNNKQRRIDSMYRSGDPSDFKPAYPGADYSQEQIDKMTEAEKIAKIDGYVPEKDRKKSKELGKKEKNFNFKRPKAPGKQKYDIHGTDERAYKVNQKEYDAWAKGKNAPDIRYLGQKENKKHLEDFLKSKKDSKKTMAKQKMTLEERRAKHIADNKFRTDAAVDQHKENMRKKQLKAYKERGAVFVDAKTGKTIGKQKAKLPPKPQDPPKSIKARPKTTGYLNVRQQIYEPSMERPLPVILTPTMDTPRLGTMTTPKTKVKKKKKIISKVKKFFKTKKK